MVGREVRFKTEKKPAEPKDTILTVEDLYVKDARDINIVRGLDLEVKRGEIVGIAGVDGNGQTELIEAITGIRNVEKGKILLSDKDIIHFDPRRVTESGVGHIPLDRQRLGLDLQRSEEH